MDEVIAFVVALPGTISLRPQPGDGSPEISWGDVFFYFAPDGVVPTVQPFATIVTKDYPGDEGSRLNRPGAFRVNVAAGTAEFSRRSGRGPRDPTSGDVDPAAVDVIFPHPVYGSLGWLSVVNPGPETTGPLCDLLRSAHQAARRRRERRAGVRNS